ncbi:hypothetical protein [Burkholderia mayonis]|nr:hypothetical protein [Burkholderia mayonis]
MSALLVTGSAGLSGSEVVETLAPGFARAIGIGIGIGIGIERLLMPAS